MRCGNFRFKFLLSFFFILFVSLLQFSTVWTCDIKCLGWLYLSSIVCSFLFLPFDLLKQKLKCTRTISSFITGLETKLYYFNFDMHWKCIGFQLLNESRQNALVLFGLKQFTIIKMPCVLIVLFPNYFKCFYKRNTKAIYKIFSKDAILIFFTL